MTNLDLILKLERQKSLKKSEWVQLIKTSTDSEKDQAAALAREIAVKNFGKNIFFRGIIEFTNICRNNCYYCGIRGENQSVSRYRLTNEEILECCHDGYENGFRTFVLQGGEDLYFTDEKLSAIIAEIKQSFPDCAVTLSVGERSEQSYKTLFSAGADRYLLRHETACEAHYKTLHPDNMSFKNRMNCLQTLKKIGYQTGCGCMVGSPNQTAENLAEDMIFMCEFSPAMVGMGPFIPASGTPFENCQAGSEELTLFLLSLCRIAMPKVLLPATTALGTIKENGRQLGVLCGCNVVMPNLSPLSVRQKYLLYNNKAGVLDSTEMGIKKLKKQMDEIGYNVVSRRGDYEGDENFD